MLVFFIALLFAGLSVCSTLSPFERPQGRHGDLAPLYGLQARDRLPDEFIVNFRKDHTHKKHFEIIGKDLSTSNAYTHFDYGYTMNLSNAALRDDVRRDPGVLLVETNRYGDLIDSVDTVHYDSRRTESEGDNEKRYTQNTVTNAPHGLQMLAASGKLPIPVRNGGTYDYVDRAGQGVNVYIFDSGIRITHKSFTGRASNFGGLAPTSKSPYCNSTMDDVRGHGTHVAGIVGARTYGVAPQANLINVKVVNNNGNQAVMAQMQQAVLDVIKDHNNNKDKDPDQHPFRFRGSIINFSLGWQDPTPGLLEQLKRANEAGIKVYAAAGNKDMDAGNTYPCAYIQASCIAAVDSSYKKAWFSNYGKSVDYLAPGDKILSLGIESDEDLAYKWGTSMATAYATGAAAIFTFWQGLVNDQAKGHFADYVWWNSLSGLATGFSGTSNLFINTGIHSKKKYKDEPFRWAGEWPVKNHAINDASDITTPAAPDQQMTTFTTAFVKTTVSPIPGLTTQTNSASMSFAIPSSSPLHFDTLSALSALSSVTFSFDPSSSAATATATQ